MTHGGLNEDRLLDKFRDFGESSSRTRPGARQIILGIGDDAALFRPKPGDETILTCDWFLEGTHFLRDKHPPDSIGWKCLARAISDVAAMGGVPRCFLLSLTIPPPFAGRWLDQFLSGLRRASRRFHCVLAGGDTTRRDEVLINVTVVGEVRKGVACPRSGAGPGDLIFVSGRLGEAERGLQILRSRKKQANTKDPLMRKHLYPEPRLALGQWLATQRLASAMMDLSDGLSTDLSRLCAASGVGARIRTTAIPTARDLPTTDSLQLALHGGDDYELLFTVTARKRKRVPRTFRGVPLTEIGIVTTKRKILLNDESGRVRPIFPGGWDPFRKHADLLQRFA